MIINAIYWLVVVEKCLKMYSFCYMKNNNSAMS